ncbi:MAG: hypothetical protein AB7J32_07585 [Pseudonocardia sp.]
MPGPLAAAMAVGVAVALSIGGETGGPVQRSATVPADSWYHLGEGMDTNVSGAALMTAGPDHVTALIVRDNKKQGENRVATVTFRPGRTPEVVPVAWHGDLPEDIEAIDAVPRRPGSYVTLTSAGRGNVITLGRDGATVTGTFDVPDPGGDPKLEGFALAAVGERMLAVWADRGQEQRPATLYAAPFDMDSLGFGEVARMEVTAPYPTQDARDISDVKILPGGMLLATSAWEAGDEGPFDGAVYVPGSVAMTGDRATLTPASASAPLLVLDGRKAEAIACLADSGRCVLGADDELMGGSLHFVTAPITPVPRVPARFPTRMNGQTPVHS